MYTKYYFLVKQQHMRVDALIRLFASSAQRGDFLRLQSCPIKMRAPILYLANRWMDSKMLLTPNRFSYLVILLLVAFH